MQARETVTKLGDTQAATHFVPACDSWEQNFDNRTAAPYN